MKCVVVVEMDEVGNDFFVGVEGFVLESVFLMIEEMVEEVVVEELVLVVVGEGGVMELGVGVVDGVGSGMVFVF